MALDVSLLAHELLQCPPVQTRLPHTRVESADCRGPGNFYDFFSFDVFFVTVALTANQYPLQVFSVLKDFFLGQKWRLESSYF